jgi:hypothetical protein
MYGAALEYALRRRKEIYDALNPETKAGVAQATGMNRAIGNDVSANSAPTFTDATVAATGLSKRTIETAVARAEALGDDALKISGTSLDKGVERDALASLTLISAKAISAERTLSTSRRRLSGLRQRATTRDRL